LYHNLLANPPTPVEIGINPWAARAHVAGPNEAGVQIFILDTLWHSLPRPPFTDEKTQAVGDRVYNYVWQLGASHESLVA
jgi:hypothetical protein